MLIVKNLFKTYNQRNLTLDVLKNINFAIPNGAFCAITGPSGSGKTTLMNLIGLLDRATKGEIIIDGKNTELLSDNESADFRNQSLGFVFQAFHLLSSMTALDNVALPLLYRGVKYSKRREIAHHWLSLVGLDNRVDHTPDELSGGQKQRVAIARALITEPSLILADEPTGNLDSKTAEEILQLFLSLNQSLKSTIVIVTHDKDIARACRSHIVLRDGCIDEMHGLDI